MSFRYCSLHLAKKIRRYTSTIHILQTQRLFAQQAPSRSIYLVGAFLAAGSGCYLYNSLNRKTFDAHQANPKRKEEARNAAIAFVGTCLIVHVAWKFALLSRSVRATKFLFRNFCIHPASNPQSMLLHQVSHRGIFHLAINSVATTSFILELSPYLNFSQTAAVFICSASTGALVHVAIMKYYTKPEINPLMFGASGGCCGLFAFFTALQPLSEVYLLFFPFTTFYSWTILGSCAVLDAVSIAMKWKGVANGAHLGGYLTGYAAGSFALATLF